MNVHATAIIHPQARIAADATIGPYSVIGDQVEIGASTEVMSHVVIEGPTTIGRRNRIFPWASIGLPPQDLKYRGELTRLEIGDDNIIREFVTLHRGTQGGAGVTYIGSHSLLMAYVHVAHDCRIGNYVIMANGASLAGHVEIQDHASLGAFCLVHQFCRIGAYSFVGSATLVNKDILPYSKSTAPRPVEVLGANRIGLERQGFSDEDLHDLDRAFRLLTRSKLNTTQALEAIEAEALKSNRVRTLVEFIKTSERGVEK